MLILNAFWNEWCAKWLLSVLSIDIKMANDDSFIITATVGNRFGFLYWTGNDWEEKWTPPTVSKTLYQIRRSTKVAKKPMQDIKIAQNTVVGNYFLKVSFFVRKVSVTKLTNYVFRKNIWDNFGSFFIHSVKHFIKTNRKMVLLSFLGSVVSWETWPEISVKGGHRAKRMQP